MKVVVGGFLGGFGNAFFGDLIFLKWSLGPDDGFLYKAYFCVVVSIAALVAWAIVIYIESPFIDFALL